MSHCWQLVDPCAVENLPATQGEHVAASIENFPGSQDEHQPAPALEDSPAPQLEHDATEVAPVVAKYFPSAHASHRTDAMFDSYLPIGHT